MAFKGNELALFLFLQLLVITYIDVKTRKISNYWSLANLVLAPIVAWQMSALSFSSVGLVVVSLVLGIGLFAIGLMGAGDSKLIASLLLYYSLDHQLLFLEHLIGVSLLVGLCLMLVRAISRWSQSWEKLRLGEFKSLWGDLQGKAPYSPSILLAFLSFAWSQQT